VEDEPLPPEEHASHTVVSDTNNPTTNSSNDYSISRTAIGKLVASPRTKRVSLYKPRLNIIFHRERNNFILNDKKFI